MKDRLKKLSIGILLTIFSFVILFYLFVSLYYKDGFTYGTWINGVYAAGRSVESINEELVNNFNYTKIVISSDLYDSEEILLSDIDFSIDYKDGLEKLYKSKVPFLWFLNIFSLSAESYFEPTIHFDDEKLVDAVNSLILVKETDSLRPQTVKLICDKEKGYYLNKDTTPVLKENLVLEKCKESMYSDFNVYIEKDEFKERSLSKEASKQEALYLEILPLLKTKITLDFGAEIYPVDSAVLSGFYDLNDELTDFIRDDNGNIKLNEERVKAYITDLCNAYDTYKKPREYATFNGAVKHIALSVYGTKIDTAKEKEYLINAIKEGITENHIPSYIHEGYARGLNDIGDTFIEVDLTNQVLYFIKENNLDKTFDIVSGNPNNQDATIEVIAYINRKRQRTYLRGEGYCSYVDYWMPFYKGLGLHDASWQKSFGGTRYLTNGSKGCINMQKEDARYIFENIEEGIPVIVYK